MGSLSKPMALACLISFSILSSLIPCQSQIAPVIDDDLFARKEQQIPWKLDVSKPHLAFNQRQQVVVQAVVPAEALLRTGSQHHLALLVRVWSAKTSERLGEMTLQVPAMEGMPRRGQIRLTSEREVVFTVRVMLGPGDFTLGIALLDRITNQLSVAVRPIVVRPLKNDPLLAVVENLPLVEFLAPTGNIDLDTYYGPADVSRLGLSVPTRRRVELAIVGNYDDPAVFLPLLRVLSELRPENGSVNVNIVRLEPSEVVFQQDDVRQLNWEHLRSALDEVTDPSIRMPLNCNRCSTESALFLKELLAQRICQDAEKEIKPRGSDLSLYQQSSKRPLRVVILLTSPTEFPRGWKRILQEGPKCEITEVVAFQVLFSPWSTSTLSGNPRTNTMLIYSNDILGLLKEHNPRVFRVLSPADFRRALAVIVETISESGT